METTARERLIVALDMSELMAARQMMDRLRGVVTRFKVGAVLLIRGQEGLRLVMGQTGWVFSDPKLHDTPETVRRAAREAAEFGVNLITVHTSGGPRMLEAAVAGAREGGSTQVIGITVLTSLDRAELAATGVEVDAILPLVLKRAVLAKTAGCAGVVASPQEVAEVRRICGPNFLVITPGIRVAGGELGGQRRVGTAKVAIADGADMLVIGRPITEADEPIIAAQAFLSEIRDGERLRMGVELEEAAT